MSQAQLLAMLQNRAKTARHNHRMQNDPEYRALIEREAREYEEFCKIHGEMAR